MTLKSNRSRSPLTVITAFFVIFTAVILIFQGALARNGIDTRLLLITNLLLFVISQFTLKSSLKAINNPNPHAFVRSYYAGFLIRLLTLGAAAFIYIYRQQGVVHKGSLFICLGIYGVYSAIEVTTLRKRLHESKDA